MVTRRTATCSQVIRSLVDVLTSVYAGQCTRSIDPAQSERGSCRLEFQTLQSAIKIYRFSMVTFCWAAVRRPNELCKKIKSLIRTWVPGEDMPDDLAAWHEVDPFPAPITLSPSLQHLFQVYNKGEWDTIILKYIIPKLSINLRTNFRIDPCNQVPYLPTNSSLDTTCPLIHSVPSF